MKKIIIGAVFAGAVTAALIGSGTASAAPGISVAAGDHTFGVGDQTSTGAQAVAKPGNTAVAVSILAPSRADASRGGSETFGEGNNVLSIGSDAATGPDGGGNNVVATGGAVVRINGNHDNVVTVAGSTSTDAESNRNIIVNAGGTVSSDAQGDGHGDGLAVNVCGTSVAGQAAHITVSPGGC